MTTMQTPETGAVADMAKNKSGEGGGREGWRREERDRSAREKDISRRGGNIGSQRLNELCTYKEEDKHNRT